MKNAVKSWIYQLELWAGHLKAIEGDKDPNVRKPVFWVSDKVIQTNLLSYRD